MDFWARSSRKIFLKPETKKRYRCPIRETSLKSGGSRFRWIDYLKICISADPK
jgi:hypothetical protein